jgi:hypothetical protein
VLDPAAATCTLADHHCRCVVATVLGASAVTRASGIGRSSALNIARASRMLCSMIGQTAGHLLELGEYSISILDAEVAVMGPSGRVALRAEDLLVDLLASEEGARLIAAAVRARGPEPTSALAVRLELPASEASEDSGDSEQAADADPGSDRRALRTMKIPSTCRPQIDKLQALCARIVEDGVVDDAELRSIDAWIHGTSEAADLWPVSELRDILTDIRSDGVVTSDERLRLLTFLQAIAAVPALRTEAAETIFDEIPKVEFPEKLFVFTGELEKCSREEALKHVRTLGGRTSNSASRKIHYLIVGSLGSEDWAHSRYGRKIQVAMQWKRKGFPITIARETDFVTALAREGIIK